eukprot:234950_1
MPNIRQNTIGIIIFLRDKKAVLELELDIIDVISETIGFEAFMNHLNKEFSMENLLALIEFNQFKQRYREIKRVQACLETGTDPLAALSRKASTKGKIIKIMTKMKKKLSVAGAEDERVDDEEEIEEQEKEDQEE